MTEDTSIIPFKAISGSNKEPELSTSLYQVTYDGGGSIVTLEFEAALMLTENFAVFVNKDYTTRLAVPISRVIAIASKQALS